MTRISSTHHVAMATGLTDLPFSEQLFLWAIRMWARAHNEGSNIHNVLHNGFKLAGIPSAFGALDTMMTIFATTGRGVMDIRCPKCTEISLDEHRLIGAIAVLQYTDQVSDSNAYLSRWMPSAALRILRGHTSQLADIMKKHGLLMRARPWARNLSSDHEMVASKIPENRTLN